MKFTCKFLIIKSINNENTLKITKGAVASL